MGHARALVSLPDRGRPAAHRPRGDRARPLGARDRVAREARAGARHEDAAAAPKPKDVHTRAAEDAMHRAIGAPVEIVRKGRGGSVVIKFASEDELQRLYDYLTNNER